MATLKMGTRGSALALAQSGAAARSLEALHPGLAVETVVIKTHGDMFGAPSQAAAKALPQGAKGLWIKELEEALLDGRVDFAIHSAKDLPAHLAPRLMIAAFPEREDARDALVARPGLTWRALGASARVATSSLRRQLLISAAKPVSVQPLRGNVDTRLRKLAEGEFDAMVVAVAGLKRLGLAASVPHEALDPSIIPPSPAQGALAVEIRSDRADVQKIVAALDHAETRLCVEMERHFLAALGGGCGSPVAAYARRRTGGILMDGFFAREGEKTGKRVVGLCTNLAWAETFATDLAAQAQAR
jgi:hydroxymethylbilane synthase